MVYISTMQFKLWLKENFGLMGYRYVHRDGRGLMNNQSLNYEKLNDDEYSDIEDEYLGLQQPPSSIQNQQVIFVFTKEGEQKHQKLIELLSKASKTGVNREEILISEYEIIWQSTDGQLGLVPAQQENFGPAHTGGMHPPKQIPFTRADAEKRPNDPVGISGTLDDYPPDRNESPTAAHDRKESEGDDCYNCRKMKKKMKKKP